MKQHCLTPLIRRQAVSMSVNALAVLTGLKHYSAFIFAPLAIFVNVATSSRISLSNPSGVVGCGCKPIGVQRCFASGSERMRTISRLSFEMIERGTPDEVSSPNHRIDS